jgi:hypothetical protein
MASNFRFTGAPKVAMYNPKGLDYFLAAPKLEAEVRGTAMMANEMATNDMRGLHSKDLAMANKMTERINTQRDKTTEALLNNEPVTTAMVSDVIKNIQQKNEVDQKLAKGLENAKRIEQFNQQINSQILKGGDAKYYGKVREDSLAGFEGSWNPDGSMNEFAPADTPQYVDILKTVKDRAAVVMQNMEKQQPGSTQGLNLKMVPFKVDGGTQYMMTYDKPTQTMNNYDALDEMLLDINQQITNPDTDMGAMASYMGDEYMSGIMTQVPGLVQDYRRTKETADPSLGINMGKFVPDADPSKTKRSGMSQVQRGQGSRIMHSNVSAPKKGQIAGKTLNEFDEVLSKEKNPATGKYTRRKDYNSYSKSVENDVMNMAGVASTNLSDWNQAISPNIDNSELSEDGRKIYNTTNEFRGFINKRLQEGNFWAYEDFQDATQALQDMGITDFKLTEDEAYHRMPHIPQAGVELTSKQKNENFLAQNQLSKVTELKNEAYQALSSMYNEYQGGQRDFLFSSGINFETIENNKIVDREKDVMREISSTLDGRTVFAFTENPETNGLDIQYMSSADKNLQDKDSPYVNFEADFAAGLKGNDYEKLRFVSNEDFGKYFPEVMQNVDDATRDQIANGTNGMYLAQRTRLDKKGNAAGPKEYVFISAGNEISNPANTAVEYQNRNQDEKPTTGTINNAVGTMDIGDVVTLRVGDNFINIKRATGDKYAIEGDSTPYSKRTLLNFLYDTGL